MPERFAMKNRSDFMKMTADQAQLILKEMNELEFSKFMGFSIVFSPFKV